MNLRVVLRSGIGEPRNSEAVDDIEQKKRKRHNRKASPQEQLTTLWETTARWHESSDYAVAEYYTEVLERPMAGHVAVNYPKMALEEQAKVTEPQPEVQVVKRNEDETLAVVFL